MITVAKLELRNWVRFNGDHYLDLGAGVHAVTARWEDNPQRSNWGGKSSSLWAIYFAFYGEHPFDTEDEWITRGQRLGYVRLTLDVDGQSVVIDRRRERGKATKLTVQDCTVSDEVGEPRKLAGDEAQLFIDQLLGLSKEDFRNTCFIEQKQMDRFIRERPAKRMDMVVDWLQMGALEAAHDDVASRLSAAIDAQTKLEVNLATATSALRDEANHHGWDPDQVDDLVNQSPQVILQNVRDSLEHQIRDQQERIDQADGNVQLLATQREKLAEHRHDFEAARECAQVAQEGKALKARIAQADKQSLNEQRDQARQQLDRCVGEQRVRTQEADKLKTVAAGLFDGRCPVAQLECPAAARINSMRHENQQAYCAAEERCREATRQRQDAQQAYERCQQVLGQVERDETRLEAIRQRFKALQPAAIRIAKGGESPSCVDNDQDIAAATQAAADARVAMQQLRVRLEYAQGAAKKVDALREQLSITRAQVDLLREAKQVLGRNGAQREIASRMLQDVEQAANQALQDCGVDLRVQVRWSHESQGLARACDACGAQYPSSAKVKVCSRCGAERGPQLINRLDVVLSDRSGAAEDLTGIVIQLAARAWLLEERGSGLSLAILDEPFGALDAQHRGALAAHLSTMLAGRYGCAQSFVVAHHQQVVDALPCRVEIVAGPDGSRFAHEG